MGEYIIINSKNDYFGFLPFDKDIDFNGGKIEVVSNYDEINEYINLSLNNDSCIYLPTLVADSSSINNNGNSPAHSLNKSPETTQADFIQRLPFSHKLSLENEPYAGKLREYDGAFLMHLAGYLFGYRLQFYDWFFDGRILMSPFHDIIVPDEVISDFFSDSYEEWKKWDLEIHRKFINILIMLCRAECYFWVWEKFLIYNMVAEALYIISNSLHIDKTAERHERIKEMCVHYGLKYYEKEIETIIKLRNDLVRESVWDGNQPCTGSSQESYLAVESLKRICLRLIPAVLSYKIGYISTDWRPYGTYLFK